MSMPVIIPVAATSQVGEARRAATKAASERGFNEERVGQIALVATEMATNLVKHGGGGMLAISRFDDHDGLGLELLALDRGPGMADFQRCLADGYSTAGSAGQGLGAISRQADRFAIYTRPQLGTVLLARFMANPAGTTPSRWETGIVMAPYPGELVCGDGWSLRRQPDSADLLLVDGLGHGAQAAVAAETAVRTFCESGVHDCVREMELVHLALGPTRGAAAALARIDMRASLVRFVGVGNIVATMIAGGVAKRLVSHNGTAGHLAPRIREFTYPFVGTPLVILHSDGLGARWDLASYPGLAESPPSIIAGVLFRDFRRDRDDAAVLAVRAVA